MQFGCAASSDEGLGLAPSWWQVIKFAEGSLCRDGRFLLHVVEQRACGEALGAFRLPRALGIWLHLGTWAVWDSFGSPVYEGFPRPYASWDQRQLRALLGLHHILASRGLRQIGATSGFRFIQFRRASGVQP
eukprot:9354269-Pyramimonas_sp.AAC.1